MVSPVKRSRFDSLKLGLMLGIVVPLVAVLIFYLWSFTKVPLSYFFKYTIQINALTKLISLCVIPNLLFFFLYLRKNYYLTSRGILMATFLWTIFAFVFKFIAE